MRHDEVLRIYEYSYSYEFRCIQLPEVHNRYYTPMYSMVPYHGM